jgi:AraC family transcriptional regulator
MIQPRITNLQEKKLVGIAKQMSLVNNKTGLLWAQFAPKIKDIKNRVSEDKISLQMYPKNYYANFNPTTEFTKWATVEVVNFDNKLPELNTLLLESGLYAVFDYKGSSLDTSIYENIFFNWLPNSKYKVDNRPHFEILGNKYKNNDPNSEEEIWIPIKEKN